MLIATESNDFATEEHFGPCSNGKRRLCPWVVSLEVVGGLNTLLTKWS